MGLRRVLISVALVISFSPCVTLAGQSLTSGADIVRNAKHECRSFENGEFHATEKAITLHDITGDGKPEEFVDGEQFSCSTALTLWGGTGGTYLWVVVAGKPYEFLAHRWKVVDVGDQNVLLLAVHSSQCSETIGPCYRAFVWQDGFRTTRSGVD